MKKWKEKTLGEMTIEDKMEMLVAYCYSVRDLSVMLGTFSYEISENENIEKYRTLFSTIIHAYATVLFHNNRENNEVSNKEVADFVNNLIVDTIGQPNSGVLYTDMARS